MRVLITVVVSILASVGFAGGLVDALIYGLIQTGCQEAGAAVGSAIEDSLSADRPSDSRVFPTLKAAGFTVVKPNKGRHEVFAAVQQDNNNDDRSQRVAIYATSTCTSIDVANSGSGSKLNLCARSYIYIGKPIPESEINRIKLKMSQTPQMLREIGLERFDAVRAGDFHVKSLSSGDIELYLENDRIDGDVDIASLDNLTDFLNSDSEYGRLKRESLICKLTLITMFARAIRESISDEYEGKHFVDDRIEEARQREEARIRRIESFAKERLAKVWSAYESIDKTENTLSDLRATLARFGFKPEIDPDYIAAKGICDELKNDKKAIWMSIENAYIADQRFLALPDVEESVSARDKAFSESNLLAETVLAKIKKFKEGV